jgi:protein-S-isoprenylcysteine O-methyltransferase Ste14
MAKKIAFYGFPVLGCCLFWLVFAYAIGFLLNFVVPKSIDSGPEGPIAGAVIVNLCLVGLFGIQHSFMARQRFKKMAGTIHSRTDRAWHL